MATNTNMYELTYIITPVLSDDNTKDLVNRVSKYIEDNGTDVQLLGWDKEGQTGSFSGDFENQDNGRRVTEDLISEGADIILPVAGPVGLGAAAAAQDAGPSQKPHSMPA